MQRRSFLFTTVLAAFAPLSLAAVRSNAVRFLSVRGDRQGGYFVSGIAADGTLRFDLPLPGRAHAIAVHPDAEEALVIARRPGRFMLRIDLRNGHAMETLSCGEQRHLYGHALYSPDGSRLYTTENDFETGRGVIGVRDVHDGYRLIDEFYSGGIGPHELRLLSDGRTLVVANGGVRTHPDFDRTPLNLEQMQPVLAYIDRLQGRELESHRLPGAMHQNSIRHLDVGADDRVCLAMQYRGPKNHQPPLIALHRRGQPMQLLSAPDPVQARMHNYCGSVCADRSGTCFAVSSPRGNLTTFWSGSDGRYLGEVRVKDGCGLAAGEVAGEFLLSSGAGALYRYRLTSGELESLVSHADDGILWDNHMAGLMS